MATTTATATRTRYTYQDYLNLPDDAERRELIAGEYCIMPSPSEKHQFAVGVIFAALLTFAMERRLGMAFVSPFDVVLSPTDVFQPDAMFLSNERYHLRTGANIRGAPDLVVEVLSPSTADRDRAAKRDRYAQAGVQEYWLADPDAKTIEVLTAHNNAFRTAAIYAPGDALASPLLPGFALNVDAVFAEF